MSPRQVPGCLERAGLRGYVSVSRSTNRTVDYVFQPDRHAALPCDTGKSYPCRTPSPSRLYLARRPDGRQLRSNINLSIGLERTGLIGRNGVGKTTLLKPIAGERPPSSGTLSVSGSIRVLRQELQVLPGEAIADLFDARDRARKGHEISAAQHDLADAEKRMAEVRRKAQEMSDVSPPAVSGQD